jgi:RNA polymerase sigma-70 factor, ECF subfamily
MATPQANTSETELLLQRAAGGDQRSWGMLLMQHRERLRRMIALRLDHRLQGRLDPSDVQQEPCLEASTRLQAYQDQPSMPFFLWLRFLTGQKLVTLHRQHLGVQMRDAGREVSLEQAVVPEASSAALAAQLLGHDPRPSEAAMQAEKKRRFEEVLERLDPLDREMLALRHFEQLTNAEAARVLNLQESAASKRYIRAVGRLKEVLRTMPGGFQEFQP